MKKQVAKTLIASSLLALSMGAYAASANGLPGASSTGYLDVSFTMPGTVLITNLKDKTLVIDPFSLTGAINDVCVFSTQTTDHEYFITATSSYPSGSDFQVYNGVDYIAYSLKWYGVAGLTDNSDLQHNVKMGYNNDSIVAFNGSGDAACASVGSHYAKVEATISDTTGKSVGTYTDTLTLLVEPT